MKKFLFLVPLLLTLSCAKEENQNLASIEQSSSPSTVSTTISPADALSNLNDLLNEFNVTTKSERSYNYNDIQSVGCNGICVSTKTNTVEIPDTLFYIVNFAEDNGFAVLAGDTRLSDKVMCITEQGVITPQDFSSAYDALMSPSTKSVVEADDEIFTEVGKIFVPALMLSSMLNDLKYGPIVDTATKTVGNAVVTNRKALLRTKWGQNEPFNTYTPLCADSTNHCPTGCVATACAQIMQYNRRPANPRFDETDCSWNDMETVCSITDRYGLYASDSAKEQVARFLYHIGKREYCYIRYDDDGSSGYAAGVVRTLENCAGYPTVKKYTGFGSEHQQKASYMIRDNKPVYLDGSDFQHGTGHAWVLDGEWGNYFHCNWGWNGDWDGYYAKHNYFPVSYREGCDSTDPGTTNESVENQDYDWNFRMVTYAFN